ncbi:MAG: hypothetical protein ACYCS7_12300 [Acidimicrobiales bacterium]
MRKLLSAFAVAALAASASLAPAAPAQASSSGTSVNSVQAVVTPNTAGALAHYTVGFITSSSGGFPAGGTITLTAPSGTGFPAAASSYTVDGAGVSSVSVSGGGNEVSITSPVAVGNSTGVSVSVLSVTNPAPGTDTLAVATSSDPGGSSSRAYPIESTTSAQSAVANVTAQASLTNAGAALSTYTVGFDTSATGGLLAGATITLTGPGNMIFSGDPLEYSINGAAPLSAQASANPSTVTLTLGTGGPGASAPVTVIAKNANNVTAAGDFTLAVHTSADADPAASTIYTLFADPSAVSSVTVGVNPAGAGQAATYKIGFDTSPQGALNPGGSIQVSAPGGTVFPGAASAYSVNGQAVGSVTVSGANGGTANQVVVTLAHALAASSAVTLSASGVTNPPAGVNYALIMSTSADTASVSSGPYTITGGPPGAVINVTANLYPAVAGRQASYAVGFDTSSAGALAGPPSGAASGASPTTGGTITIQAPAGTSFQTPTTDYKINGWVPSAVSLGSNGTSVTLTLALGQSIGDSTGVTVDAYYVTNPPAGGSYRLAVHTSADPQAVTSNSYTLAAAS